MKKTAGLWLSIIATLALLAGYQSLFPTPVQTSLERFLGLSAFVLLSITLALGPLAILFPEAFDEIKKQRRATGLAAFALLAGHSLFIINERQYSIPIIAADPKLLIAALALAVFAVLAATSNNFAIRAMGFANWKNLQRFSYLAFALSFLHFLQSANGLFLPLGGGKTFANLGEIFAILSGIAAIALQAAGFGAMKTRQQQEAQASQIGGNAE